MICLQKPLPGLKVKGLPCPRGMNWDFFKILQKIKPKQESNFTQSSSYEMVSDPK
jgi:hypothetical protein